MRLRLANLYDAEAKDNAMAIARMQAFWWGRTFIAAGECAHLPLPFITNTDVWALVH